MNLQPLGIDFFFRAQQPRHNRKIINGAAPDSDHVDLSGSRSSAPHLELPAGCAPGVGLAISSMNIFSNFSRFSSTGK